MTYVWQEGGLKRRIYIARRLPSSYALPCASNPVMQSIIVELAE